MLLEFKEVYKDYAGVLAVNGVSFSLEKGDFAALVGPSGSGKTSLLNLASGLDRATRGEITISGRDITRMGQREIVRFRRSHLGFVFQAYNLFPVLSAVENVEYTRIIRGDKPMESRRRAEEALRAVGLGDKLDARPHQLSGGQQQRVAVARALATDPDIVFADEPTANLDSVSARQLIGLFEELNASLGVTFLFSTHDMRLVERVRSRIGMIDGKIEKIERQGR